MRVWLLAMLLALGIAGTLPAQTQPLLQLQGQPYFGGSMTLHLTGTVGQPALPGLRLDPLPLGQPSRRARGLVRGLARQSGCDWNHPERRVVSTCHSRCRP
jgi:hypothetical protein